MIIYISKWKILGYLHSPIKKISRNYHSFNRNIIGNENFVKIVIENNDFDQKL
jgi:hypothetical protein